MTKTPPSPSSVSPDDVPLRTISERRAMGKGCRETVSREQHAEWSEPSDRADPIQTLIDNSRRRIAALLPIRYARMAESPFAFLRGSAVVMAADFGSMPSSGIRVQACGDCHLMNFGVYASPEGTPVFDINDFDETLPAPFEWDIKRLATSIVLAGRHAEASEKACGRAARAAVRSYREHLSLLAERDPFQIWHSRIDVKKALLGILDAKERERQERRVSGTDVTNPAYDDFPKLAASTGNGYRIKDNPPLIFHFDMTRNGSGGLHAEDLFLRYRETLPEERRILYDRYRFVDAAFKVVGVGSVGTFCAIGLFMTADGAPLFLQIKEAAPSVLAPFAGASPYGNQGQRVVVGQRIIQAATDIFLGWTEDTQSSRHFYLRQLKDRKLASIGAAMQTESLEFYANLCGSALARAHARSGDAVEISGYLGSSETFDAAIEAFAAAYAHQCERDHRLLIKAIEGGRLPSQINPPDGKDQARL